MANHILWGHHGRPISNIPYGGQIVKEFLGKRTSKIARSMPGIYFSELDALGKLARSSSKDGK